MPRAEKLSSRLDALIEDIFASPSDPFALYWSIAAQISRNQLAAVQTKIKKTLRQREEIGAESAVLLACVLHLTGFPPHRLLHFLSLYIPGGIRLDLFELAVSAVFLGKPPIPAHLLYDLTQYTYLEKRLLVRKSMEISGMLKGSLTPAVLLYLYLLSLRDDLSNENVQLIALIMKDCFPAQEIRTRLGGASLEEYGEIARAWKAAERRSRDMDLNLGAGTSKGMRAFDRNSASFFLDKYFSDEALSEMRAAAPTPPKRPVQRRPAPKPDAAPRPAPRSDAEPGPAPLRPPAVRSKEGQRKSEETPAAAPAEGVAASAVMTGRAESRPVQQPASQQPAAQQPAARGKKTTGGRRAGQLTRATAETARRRQQPSLPAQNSAAVERDLGRRVLRLAPTVCAAVVMALVLIRVSAAGSQAAASTAPPPAIVVAPAAPAQPASVQPTPAQPAPAPPETTTYTVRPGDSLWKIFTSMRAQAGDRKGWMDFLVKTQSMNGLGDPDRLQPGKILTLSARE